MAGNTALNITNAKLATNKSGGSVAYGDVVVVDLTTDDAFTTTAVLGYTTTGIGVVLEPNGIANNASGLIAMGGWVPQINLSAAASRGDYVRTSGAVKTGVPHAAPALVGDFAEVWGTGTTPAAQLLTPLPTQVSQSSSTTIALAVPLIIPRL